jgi:hypothetical protein
VRSRRSCIAGVQRMKSSEHRSARKARISDRQDKGAQHGCCTKPMSAHGFLPHAKNCPGAAGVLQVTETNHIPTSDLRWSAIEPDEMQR